MENAKTPGYDDAFWSGLAVRSAREAWRAAIEAQDLKAKGL